MILNFQKIRFTNCLWNAIEVIKFSDPHGQSTTDGSTNHTSSGKTRSSGGTRAPRTNDVGANPFSVVVVMKVLEECLITVPMNNERCRKVGDIKISCFTVPLTNVTIHFKNPLYSVSSTVTTVLHLVSRDHCLMLQLILLACLTAM